MNSRLGFLGALIALLPLSVDVPALRDSSGRHETRLTGALSTGEFSIVNRGCNGEILDRVRTQIHSGALAVEHEFPNDIVIGVRGGVVEEDLDPVDRLDGDAPSTSRTNRYWNPHVGFESRRFGVGVGYLRAERRFLETEDGQFAPDASGHIRLGDSQRSVTVRFMEDLPLASDGYLNVEVGGSATRNLEVGVLMGMIGPYDGVTLGMKARVWFTPAAAVQIRGSLGGLNQYNLGAGISTRLPWGGR